ncbi:MAG: glycosyltransferase [Melioribacteraceae bacterium]|nr:glycosyltransferase [Melioribacteraceae bacterium]
MKNGKYKIVHVIDKLSVDGSGVHGVTKVLESWIKNFNREEFEFSIISLRAQEKAEEIFQKINVPIKFLNRSKIDPRTILDLTKIINQEKPDLLHLHGYGAANFGRIVSKIKKIPNLVHEHAILTNQPFYQTIADTILAPLTDKAVGVSSDVVKFLQEYRKTKKEKLEVINNGIDTEGFKIPTEEQIIKERDRLKIPGDYKVVCKVGRLDRGKGHEYLFRAAKKVLNVHPKTIFLIVGAGPEHERLEALTHELKINNNVVFTGYHTHVEVCLGLSNIFAFTSLSEGFCVSVLEAMNAGLPVVSFPVGGVNELIQDSKNGFIVPMKDVDKLEEKISLLLNDDELSRKIGDCAKVDCKNFDVKYSVQKLANLYKTLIN